MTANKKSRVEQFLLWVTGIAALISGFLMIKKGKELAKEKSENAELKIKYIDIKSQNDVANSSLSDLVDKSNLQYRKRIDGKRPSSKSGN